MSPACIERRAARAGGHCLHGQRRVPPLRATPCWLRGVCNCAYRDHSKVTRARTRYTRRPPAEAIQRRTAGIPLVGMGTEYIVGLCETLTSYYTYTSAS